MCYSPSECCCRCKKLAKLRGFSYFMSDQKPLDHKFACVAFLESEGIVVPKLTEHGRCELFEEKQ